MNRKDQIKHILNIVSNLILFIFIALSFGDVFIQKYSEISFNRNVAVIFLYLSFLLLLTRNLNGNRLKYTRVLELAASYILAIIVSDAVGFILIKLVNDVPVSVKPMILLALVQVTFAWLWIVFTKMVNHKIYPSRKVIIIHGTYPLQEFLTKLTNKTDRYDVTEILDYEHGYEKLCSGDLDFEGVFLYDLPAEERNTILKHCYLHSIRCYVVPKISDIIMKGADELNLVDTPIGLARNKGLYITERGLKRLLDIVVSGIGIIVSMPIMLIVAILVKVSDGGPVLYKQIRLTRNGKEFKMYKFRSMRLDAEKKGAQLARKNDDRITPVGRVLRNLHLDELPQLFNVFFGQMSMVGPRPERPEIFDKYRKTIPEFDFRLKVKAGLTGYAQVYGKYNTKPIDKLKLDLTYIQEYSFWLDLKLLLLTCRVAFRKETSEGVDKNQNFWK